MANTYYDSELTGEKIEQALEAIDGVIVPANNGKVLAINNGKIEARSVQWDADLGPKSITENGTYNPASDNLDGYSQVTVNVSGATDANDVTYDSSETYDSGTIGAALNEQKNSFTAVENGIALRNVGNTAANTINVDSYVYVMGHSSIPEGLYQNTSGSQISSGTTLSCPGNLTLAGNILSKIPNMEKKSVYLTLNASSSITYDYQTSSPTSLIAISRSGDAAYAAFYMVGNNWIRVVTPIISNSKYTLTISNTGVLTITNNDSNSVQVAIIF